MEERKIRLLESKRLQDTVLYRTARKNMKNHFSAQQTVAFFALFPLSLSMS